jgi:hypothetical protein
VVQDDGDAYDHHEVLWQYPDLTLTWMSSLTNSYDFVMRGDAQPERRLGLYFHGTDATMYAHYSTFRIMAEGDRMKGKPEVPPSIPPRRATSANGWIVSNRADSPVAACFITARSMCRSS